MASTDDNLSIEERELNMLLKESDQDRSDEQKIRGKTKKRASNDHLIDFDPLNNEFNAKENWYMAASFFIFLFAISGISMNIVAWNISKQNNDLLDQFQQNFSSLNLSNWALKCYGSNDPLNPCSSNGNSEDSLFNWQYLINYYSGTGNGKPGCLPDQTPTVFPCLEIQNQFSIFPNFSDPTRIDFADNNHLFSLSSLIFPNIDTSNNNKVKDVPFWQQSNIRTLPATRFVMNDNTNLNVEPNNIYAIQLPVIAWTDKTFLSTPPVRTSTSDYCQNQQLDDLVDKYPFFMLFNPYLSKNNGTVPSFSLCTCIKGPIQNVQPNPNLWNTMCIDGSTFTLST